MPLLRLFDENAPFVVGDVTEVERRQAKWTSYVGTLKDGKTRGFWLLTLGTPRGGRVLPFHFVTSSSQTPRRLFADHRGGGYLAEPRTSSRVGNRFETAEGRFHRL